MAYSDQNKIHETGEDRKRQREILERFSKTFGLNYEETAPLNEVDALLSNETSKALAEVKHRNISADLYPTYIIDANKITNGLEKAGENAFLLIVAWKDDIRYLHVSNYLQGQPPDKVFKTLPVKRRDRDEKVDMVFHIPISIFTAIG